MANDEMFADTRLEVVWLHGACVSRVFLVDSKAKAWDGAAEETNGATFSTRTGGYSYVELKLTGRSPKKHVGGIYGTKGRMRFTGADDSREWFDVVVRAVPAQLS